jgi:hypothetical protein
MIFVVVCDLVVMISFVHPVGSLVETFVALLEVVPASFGIYFLMAKDSKDWLSNYYSSIRV